jgi:sterol desaturase/sphingolipid hydroxylase (fatty acid hydroxylase superfamily)
MGEFRGATPEEISMTSLTFRIDEVSSLVLGFLVCLAVFEPIEAIWPVKRQRALRRSQARGDLLHFFVSEAVARLVIAAIAVWFVRSIQFPSAIASVRAQVGAQPLWLQFVEVFVLGDFLRYWVHRWSHEIPFLWKFHAIHHGVEDLDWLAAARNHPVDRVVGRIGVLFVLFGMGLSESIFYIYWLVFSPLHGVWLHSNFRGKIPVLRWIITMPEFHHWHHAMAPINKNYAGRFPVWDVIFGTAYQPVGELPAAYGCGEPIPKNYLGQCFWPFWAILPARWLAACRAGGVELRKRFSLLSRTTQ